MSFSEADRGFMEEALALARGGIRRVEPNPPVGAVLVRDGRIVGAGYHQRYGGPHAEVEAIAQAGDARGADLFVTLEPCGHQGKTPPCAEAIAAAGIRRVVYAAADPNPATAGKGPERLRAAGVAVEEGLLVDESRALLRRFFRHLRSDLPWVIGKWAMTLDGKIADAEGGSLYITGPEAQRAVHELRGAVDGIAVGLGTVRADDPSLTVRFTETARKPVRLVLDSRLRIPHTARVVRTAKECPTWILTTEAANRAVEEDLTARGCRVIRAPARSGKVDLRAAFQRLRGEGLGRILLEGGGEVHASAFAAGVVSQVVAFCAPLLLGGRDAPTPLGGAGLRLIDRPLRLLEVWTGFLGRDAVIEGFVENGC